MTLVNFTNKFFCSGCKNKYISYFCRDNNEFSI